MNRIETIARVSEIRVGKTIVQIRYVEADWMYLRVAGKWEPVDCILDVKVPSLTLPTPIDPERARHCFNAGYNSAVRRFGPNRRNKKK